MTEITEENYLRFMEKLEYLQLQEGKFALMQFIKKLEADTIE